MNLSFGREDTIESYIDRLYSIMRTSKICKTEEEREAICKLATSVAQSTGFMRDAHSYLGAYREQIDKILSLDPMILSLLPMDALGELNRLSALTEAWQVHAEAEIFSDGKPVYGAKPDEIPEQDLDDILNMAVQRDQEFAAVGTDDAAPSAPKSNVVSLFKKS